MSFCKGDVINDYFIHPYYKPPSNEHYSHIWDENHDSQRNFQYVPVEIDTIESIITKQKSHVVVSNGISLSQNSTNSLTMSNETFYSVHSDVHRSC